MFPLQEDMFPPQNNYTGIALFQVLESLVVLLKYMMWVLKAKACL